MGSIVPALAAIALLVASPALAHGAPVIDGNWGNEAGCKFAAGGQSRDDESMAVLTAGHYEDYVTHCSFEQVLEGHGALVVTTLCGHEGEDLITAELLVIRPPADGDGSMLMVTDADGNAWAEVVRCK